MIFRQIENGLVLVGPPEKQSKVNTSQPPSDVKDNQVSTPGTSNQSTEDDEEKFCVFVSNLDFSVDEQQLVLVIRVFICQINRFMLMVFRECNFIVL